MTFVTLVRPEPLRTGGMEGFGSQRLRTRRIAEAGVRSAASTGASKYCRLGCGWISFSVAISFDETLMFWKTHGDFSDPKLMAISAGNFCAEKNAWGFYELPNLEANFGSCSGHPQWSSQVKRINWICRGTGAGLSDLLKVGSCGSELQQWLHPGRSSSKGRDLEFYKVMISPGR